MEQQTAAAYKFGPFLLEPAERRITKESVPVELTVKAFDLLALLVTRHGRLVTKDEILDSVWGDVSVTESNVTTTISTIRKALGEDAAQQPYIETIPKKGYRFVSTVDTITDTSGTNATAGSPEGGPQPWLSVVRRKGKILPTVALVLAFIIAGALQVWRHAKPPSDPAVNLFHRAIDLEKAGNDMLALETLNEAIRLKPDFDDANVKAAWIAYEDNEDDLALKYLHGVIDRNARPALGGTPESPHRRCSGLKAEGLQLLLLGDEDNALRKLQLAAEADTSDTDALYYLIDLATEMNLLEEANRAASRCRALDGSNSLCILGSITIRVYENRFSDAISEYEQASRAGVRFPWFDGPIGFAKLAQGDPNGALEHFRALQDSGTRIGSSVHFRASQEGIAGVALYQGRIEDARRQVIAALDTSRSDHDKASYYLYLAQIDQLHGRSQEAKQEVQAALGLSQSDDLAIVAARVLVMSGDHESARNVLNAHQATTARLGKSYAAADRLVRAGLMKDAHKENVAALADAYRYDPVPEVAYYLAKAQVQAGAWQDAVETLNGILNARGRVLIDSVASLLPLSEYNLAVCYQRLGNKAEAAKHLSAVEAMWSQADPDAKSTIALH